MDIQGLRYFISAAEYLNFTQAAKVFSITQTAMSLHIAKIEEELGFQLFLRNNRMVELTAAGQVFYNRALDVVKNYEEAVQNGIRTANGGEGHLCIFLSGILEGLLVLPHLKAYEEKHRSVNLWTQIVSPQYLMEMLRRGDADAAICLPYDFSEDPDFEIYPFRTDEIGVIVAKDHPFAKLKKVKPELLRTEKVVALGPKSVPVSYQEMRKSWVVSGIEPKEIIETGRFEDTLLAVSMNHGVTLLPKYVVENTTWGLIYLPLDLKPKLLLEVAIVCLKNYKNPAVPGLVEFIKRESE